MFSLFFSSAAEQNALREKWIRVTERRISHSTKQRASVRGPRQVNAASDAPRGVQWHADVSGQKAATKKKTFSQWVKRKESETTNRLFNPDLPVPPSFDILIWIKRSWIVRFDNFEKMYCIWRLKESHGREARLLD